MHSLQSEARSRRSVTGAVEDGLEVVAVGVEHEGAVVAGVVLRPQAGRVQRLRAQLERSHPYFMQNFTRAVPEMFDKAYRFVGEMEEIADFVGEDPQAKQMYLAFAEFYRRMAADVEGKREEADALAAFFKPKQ